MPGTIPCKATRSVGTRGRNVSIFVLDAENNQDYLPFSHVLLIFYAVISSQEYIKFLLGEREQPTILYSRPPHVADSRGIVAYQSSLQVFRQTLIK